MVQGRAARLAEHMVVGPIRSTHGTAIITRRRQDVDILERALAHDLVVGDRVQRDTASHH